MVILTPFKYLILDCAIPTHHHTLRNIYLFFMIQFSPEKAKKRDYLLKKSLLQ